MIRSHRQAILGGCLIFLEQCMQFNECMHFNLNKFEVVDNFGSGNRYLSLHLF